MWEQLGLKCVLMQMQGNLSVFCNVSLNFSPIIWFLGKNKIGISHSYEFIWLFHDEVFMNSARKHRCDQAIGTSTFSSLQEKRGARWPGFSPPLSFSPVTAKLSGCRRRKKAAGNTPKGLGRRRVVKGWRCRSLIKRALGISALWTCSVQLPTGGRRDSGWWAGRALCPRCWGRGGCRGVGGDCIARAVLSENLPY